MLETNKLESFEMCKTGRQPAGCVLWVSARVRAVYLWWEKRARLKQTEIIAEKCQEGTAVCWGTHFDRDLQTVAGWFGSTETEWEWVGWGGG